jgi:hydroxyethylthiazole kinase-like sugar kinase family protein
MTSIRGGLTINIGAVNERTIEAMGLAGEIGLSRQQPGDGNSTLRNRIIDAISNMTPEQLADGAKFEVK